MISPFILIVILISFVFGLTNHVVVVASINDDGTNNEDTNNTNDDDDEYLQPEVHRYTNVLPREVCDEIIRLGEDAGFPLEEDSIDDNQENNKSSQAIDVMTEAGQVKYPKIFNALKPYIPDIARLIMKQRDPIMDSILFPQEQPNRIPQLGWIFYRKYAPGSARNALIPHYDTNMFTVNIALNDDFTGGGVFIVRPRKEDNPEHMIVPSPKNNYFVNHWADGVPDLKDYQYGYEWVQDGVGSARTNSSQIIFPKLETGDALIHNYTVWHAVAPLTTGIRYSMVLFFDMHNPMIDRSDEFDDEEEDSDDDDYYGDPGDDDEEDSDEEEDDPDTPINSSFSHAIKECDVSTGNLKLIPDNIDIYWKSPYPEDAAMPLELIITGMEPGRADSGYMAYSGHEFRAYRSQKGGLPPSEDSLLARVVIQEGQNEYRFQSTWTQEQCATVYRVHNRETEEL